MIQSDSDGAMRFSHLYSELGLKPNTRWLHFDELRSGKHVAPFDDRV